MFAKPLNRKMEDLGLPFFFIRLHSVFAFCHFLSLYLIWAVNGYVRSHVWTCASVFLFVFLRFVVVTLQLATP